MSALLLTLLLRGKVLFAFGLWNVLRPECEKSSDDFDVLSVEPIVWPSNFCRSDWLKLKFVIQFWQDSLKNKIEGENLCRKSFSGATSPQTMLSH